MQFPKVIRGRSLAVRAGMIVLVFVGFSILWIPITDQILGWMVKDPGQFARLATYKGSLYICIVAVFLFWLIVSALEATREERNAYRPEPPTEMRGLWASLAVFACAALLLAGPGIVIYRGQRRQAEQKAAGELSDYARIQAQQIEEWFSERKGEALVAARDPVLIAGLQRLRKEPHEAGRIRPVLEERMKALREAHRFDSVRVTDPSGNAVASSDDMAVDASERQAVARVNSTNPITLTWTMHPGQGQGLDVWVSYCASIEGTKGAAPLGALVFRVSLDRLLAQTLNRLPTFHSTVETLLLCRQGEELVYLSPARLSHRAGPRWPMARTELVGVQALRAGEGLFKGKDDEGAGTVAAARRLTSLPWVLLSKIATEELSVPIRQLSLVYGGMVALFLALSSIALFAWRRREGTRIRTEHQRIQAENRLLEYRLELLSQHANDIVLLIESDGRIRYANDRATEAYGYAQYEFQDLTIRELRSPETRADVDEQLSAVQGSGTMRFETVHRRKDGSLFPVEVSTRTLVLEDVLCIQSIIRDITERKQAEEALRQSGERYRRLFDEAGEGISLADLERGVILDCNQAFLRLTETERSQVIGKSLAQFHTPSELQLVRDHMQVTRLGKGSQEPLRLRMTAASGTEKWIEVKGSLFDLDGMRLGLGFFRDTTAEHLREVERETTLNLLRLLNEPNNSHELIGNLTSLIQGWSGCEAVGIRLREGEDFPYFETRGFPAEFVEMERQLCARDADGRILRDPLGHPAFECMCGNILCSRFDPELPFFTPKGSFWSNCTTELLASTNEQERQARTRNRCNGEGYESVALIPLRSGGMTFGLLQLNDHARNRFTPGSISFLEGVGEQIALALAKRQTQAALEGSERRFRDLSEAAGEFLWETDALGNLVFVSARITEILEYLPEELQGRSPLDIMEPVWAERIRTLAREARNFRNREVPLIARSGRIVWASITCVMKVDAKGEPAGYIGAGMDITERKQAEVDLLAAHERLALAQKGSRSGMWDWNLETGRMTWSVEMFQLLGLPKEGLEASFDLWRNALHPADREEAEARVTAAIREHVPLSSEYRIVKPSGETCYLQVFGDSVYGEDGSPLRMSGICVDVTQLRLAQEAQRASDVRFAQLFRTMNEGFAHCRMILQDGRPADWEYLDVNPAFERLLGLRDVIGRRATELVPGIRATNPEMFEIYARVAEKGVPEFFETYIPGLDVWCSISVFSPEQGFFVTMFQVITERKHAEEALRAKEADLDLALRSARMGVWIWDVQGDRRHFDERVCQLLGLDRATFMGTQDEFLRAVEPQDREVIRTAWSRTFDQDLPYEAEYRVRWQNGSVRTIHSRGRLTRDESGRPLKVNGILWDVTERKTLEDILRQSQERFRNAFLGAPFPIMVHAEDGEVLAVNDAWTETSGYSLEDIPTLESWAERAHPGQRQVALDRNQALYGITQRVLEGDFPIQTKTGETRVWEFTSSPLERMPDGRRVVISMARDVTAQREVEAAFKQKSDELERYFTESLDLLCIADTEGYFHRLNPEWEKVLGYPLEELVGRQFLDLVHPEDLTRTLNAVSTLRGQQDVSTFMNRYRCRDGSYRWIEWRSHPIGDLIYATARDITERKRLEDELRASEARFRKALAAAPFPILIHAEGGSILDLNEAWTHFSGYDLAEIPTMGAWLEKAYGEQGEQIQELIDQLYDLDKRIDEGYFTVRTKANALRTWDVASAPLGRLADGRRALITMARDVTDQQRMESALKSSEEKYRGLFATMKEGFALHEIITDAAGRPIDYRYLEVNPAFEEMTGIPRAQWVGRTVLEVIPETEAYWIEAYGRVALTGEASRIENYSEALGRWYHVIAHCPAPRQFAVLVADVTDRKRTELALEKSERFLREAQAVGRIGTYSTDLLAGRWESSAALDEIFGIDAAYPRDIPGWVKLVAPDSREDLSEYLENLLRNRSRFERDYRIVRQNDGEERWVSGLGELEFDPDGRPVRMIGTIQDITERKAAETVIRQMAEALEQRVKERTAQLEATNQELEAFSYSVSHDLRGPLRGIDGFSRALLEDYRDRLDEDGKHYLERIRNGTQRMGQLIDDLLKLSRINRSELERTDVSLTALCDKVLGDLARAHPQRRVAASIQLEMTVQADRRLMLVVLENLLGNAWKFTSRREEGRIEVGETCSPEGERRFHIRDNGAGFDMAYVGKLFNAFQRLHAADEFEGTGIGLAIVQRIIHRHGGRVWAEAEPGNGASFYFTLADRGDA